MNNIFKQQLTLSPRHLVTLSPLLLVSFLLAFTPPPTAPIHGRPKTQVRPALSGPVQTYPTEHFLVHYTLKGHDAVSSSDENDDDQPDFVEAVAEALEFSWQQEVEAMGWRSPLPDEGEGGDTKMDVYLRDQIDPFGTGDLYGYVDTFGGFVGDNPATAEKEQDTAYGYINLDNDYDPDQFGDYDITPLDSMRSTAAHEFNHVIQSAYDDNEPYIWLYEATATWMEDQVYPEIGDASSYLADYMDAPDICPLSVGRDDQDVRWYGAWLLLGYLAEQHGGPETIRHLWENMTNEDGLAALQTTLTGQKTSLAEWLTNFSVANLTKSDCPANAPYCYADGSDYLRPYIEGSLQVDAGETKTFAPKDGVQQFGADYIRLKSDGPIRLNFQGSPSGDWHLRLVGLNGDKAKVTRWEAATPATIDPSTFEKLYLVVVNAAPVEAEEDCGYHNYTLALAGGQDIILPQAPPVSADPDPYVPPTYQSKGAEEEEEEEEVDRSPSLSGGQPIAPEDAPFPPFYPGYLPSGYSLTELTRYTPADLGEWEQNYAPGGEPVLSLTYSADSPANHLTISQSPALSQTLAQWVEDLAYLENDVRLVNNQPVHLVNYGDRGSPMSVASFIEHDRFIVVEGPFDLIKIQQIVAGLLANNP